MPRFRCFLINQDDTVGNFESLELESEEQAIQRTKDLLRSSSLAVAAELWESGHFVARVPREDSNDRT